MANTKLSNHKEIYNLNYIPDNYEHKWVYYSKDIDMSFDFNQSGDIKTIVNDEAIHQNIATLVRLQPFEKLFRPGICCNLKTFLFEFFDNPMLKIQINQIIQNLFTNYESRARLIKIDYTGDVDNQLLTITVWYQIIQTLQISKVDVELEIVR